MNSNTKAKEPKTQVKRMSGGIENSENSGLIEGISEEAECWDDARQDAEVNSSSSGGSGSSSSSDSISNNEMKSSAAKVNVATLDKMMDGCSLQRPNNDKQATNLPSSSPMNDSDGDNNTNSTSTNGSDVIDLTLHEAVFNNDANRIYEILRKKKIAKKLINSKDKHGNTPLHLACMLGRSKEIVNSLLQCGASVECRNLNRWSPFQEACSYGNREVITLMTKKLDDNLRKTFAEEKIKLREHLEKTKNYRLVLKWQFQTWVPFISRILPNDVTVITKQGKFVRIDTKLLDYGDMFTSGPSKRENSCLIYSDKFPKKWVIVNHGEKQFQPLETPTSKDIETKVNEIMSFDIMDFELKSTDAQLTRTTSGWIWKADKMEQVGKYNAALYNYNNVFLFTKKRREHLKQKDLKRNKMAYKGAVHMLKFGNKPTLKDIEDANQVYDSNDENSGENWEDAEENSENHHRTSLTPPPATNVTWTQYCQSEPGQFPTLGREQKCKVVKTAFKAKIAMTNEFPITKNEFLDLLSIVPLKMFEKLKEFIEMKLPEGFPVRLEIPVFPFLTALITFEDFNFLDGPIDESLFSIPQDYNMNRNLVPLLNGKLKG